MTAHHAYDTAERALDLTSEVENIESHHVNMVSS